jgi:hypothetical protein
MVRDVMTIAERSEVPHLVWTALRLRNEVMNFEAPRRATTWHCAHSAEQREHLFAHARGHRVHGALGVRRGQIAEHSRIAPRALHDVVIDIKLTTSADLFAVTTLGALQIADGVRWSVVGSGVQEPTARGF